MSQIRTKSTKISTIMNSREFKDGYSAAVAGKPFDYARDDDFSYARGRMIATWVKAEGIAPIGQYRASMSIAEKNDLIGLFVAAKRSGAVL